MWILAGIQLGRRLWATGPSSNPLVPGWRRQITQSLPTSSPPRMGRPIPGFTPPASPLTGEPAPWENTDINSDDLDAAGKPITAGSYHPATCMRPALANTCSLRMGLSSMQGAREGRHKVSHLPYPAKMLSSSVSTVHEGANVSDAEEDKAHPGPRGDDTNPIWDPKQGV